MRRILVDNARPRMTAKRGGEGELLPLSPELAWVDPRNEQMLDLDAALNALGVEYAGRTRVVELRIILGCSAEETAEVLGVSKATVDRDMRFALAWLYDRMQNAAGASPAGIGG